MHRSALQHVGGLRQLDATALRQGRGLVCHPDAPSGIAFFGKCCACCLEPGLGLLLDGGCRAVDQQVQVELGGGVAVNHAVHARAGHPVGQDRRPGKVQPLGLPYRRIDQATWQPLACGAHIAPAAARRGPQQGLQRLTHLGYQRGIRHGDVQAVPGQPRQDAAIRSHTTRRRTGPPEHGGIGQRGRGGNQAITKLQRRQFAIGQTIVVQHHHARRSHKLEVLAGAGNGTCLLRLGIPLRADRYRFLLGHAPGDGLCTGQAIQMGLEAVQIGHHHALRLALAQHGSRLLAHIACRVQANDLCEPGWPDAGDDREGQWQSARLCGRGGLPITRVFRFAVVRVVWRCEIFGRQRAWVDQNVHTHPFNATPKTMAAA